ncbi:hypothetical protein AAFF_G00033500, partial [Aldrovandia affinis]
LSADQSDTGTYTCRGECKRSALYTAISNAIALNVLALPHVVLKLQSGWTKIFNKERVTLRCEMSGGTLTEWGYLWYRDGQELPVDKTADTYNILSAVQSDSGTYTCRGECKRSALHIDSSNYVALYVYKNIPKPLVTQDPPGEEIFTGDTVTLSCGVRTDPARWEYLWYKDTQGAALTNTDHSSPDGSSYTISSAAVSHSGEYWCRAGRGRPLFYTLYSDSLKFNITARPQAVLSLETGWTEIFRTDSLTLRCEVEGSSAEWNYTWYRDGQHLPLDNSRDRYTLTSGGRSDHSEYRCRGNRTGEASYTEISD